MSGSTQFEVIASLGNKGVVKIEIRAVGGENIGVQLGRLEKIENLVSVGRPYRTRWPERILSFFKGGPKVKTRQRYLPREDIAIDPEVFLGL